MKIVSWNCHYGLDSEKFGKIMANSTFVDADVYAFQEVLENDFINIPDFEKGCEYKYRHWYGDHREYGDCRLPNRNEGDLGIALISKTYKIQRFDQGRIKFRYVVPYILTKDNEKFILIHVWTKGEPYGYIKPIYDALEYYKEQFENEGIEKIVMLGDFNFGIKFRDERSEKELAAIEEKINKLSGGLSRSDKFENCETFRWDKNKEYYFNDCIYTKNIKMKDDDIEIGNKEDWIESNLSDHCPIMAELEI